MNDYCLGIDLGGTHLRCAIVNCKTGEYRGLNTVSTNAHEGYEQVIQRMISLIDKTFEGSDFSVDDISAIGIGVPGTVDLETGKILFLPNLPGQWRGVNLSTIIKTITGKPTYLINDVRAMTMGEWRFGAGRGQKTIACLAIGTGIGGGLVINGTLHLGIGGTAGELGHIIVEPHGLPCGCGGSGCLEMYASGPAIASLGQKFIMHGHTSMLAELSENQPSKINAEMVVYAAKLGDSRSVHILKNAGYYLGMAISNIVVTISPEMVVIGGGVSDAGEILFSSIREEIKKRVFMVPVEKVTIKQADLGVYAGLIGSAAWANDSLGN